MNSCLTIFSISQRSRSESFYNWLIVNDMCLFLQHKQRHKKSIGIRWRAQAIKCVCVIRKHWICSYRRESDVCLMASFAALIKHTLDGFAETTASYFQRLSGQSHTICWCSDKDGRGLRLSGNSACSANTSWRSCSGCARAERCSSELLSDQFTAVKRLQTLQ